MFALAAAAAAPHKKARVHLSEWRPGRQEESDDRTLGEGRATPMDQPRDAATDRTARTRSGAARSCRIGNCAPPKGDRTGPAVAERR